MKIRDYPCLPLQICPNGEHRVPVHDFSTVLHKLGGFVPKYLQIFDGRSVEHELRLERLLFVLYAYAGVFILLVWERGDVEGWHCLSFPLDYIICPSTLTIS